LEVFLLALDECASLEIDLNSALLREAMCFTVLLLRLDSAGAETAKYVAPIRCIKITPGVAQ